jgi:hypothetical protein
MDNGTARKNNCVVRVSGSRRQSELPHRDRVTSSGTVRYLLMAEAEGNAGLRAKQKMQDVVWPALVSNMAKFQMAGQPNPACSPKNRYEGDRRLTLRGKILDIANRKLCPYRRLRDGSLGFTGRLYRLAMLSPVRLRGLLCGSSRHARERALAHRSERRPRPHSPSISAGNANPGDDIRNPRRHSPADRLHAAPRRRKRSREDCRRTERDGGIRHGTHRQIRLWTHRPLDHARRGRNDHGRSGPA